MFAPNSPPKVAAITLHTSTRAMSTNAVVGGHYGGPLDGSQPPPPGLPPGAPPDHVGGGPPMKHDINEILQQIMNITDQSLDEAQARFVFELFA